MGKEGVEMKVVEDDEMVDPLIEEVEAVDRVEMYKAVSRKVLSAVFVPSVTENKGSHARDHLANERTFLAWLRTSLGAIGLGVAVARLDLLGRYGSRVCGLLFLFIGSLFLLYSTFRYYRLSALINRGLFQPNKIGVWIITLLSIVAVLAAIIIILVP